MFACCRLPLGLSIDCVDVLNTRQQCISLSNFSGKLVCSRHMQELVNSTNMCRICRSENTAFNWLLMQEHVLPLLSRLRQVTDSKQVTAYQYQRRHCCCMIQGELKGGRSSSNHVQRKLE